MCHVYHSLIANLENKENERKKTRQDTGVGQAKQVHGGATFPVI